MNIFLVLAAGLSAFNTGLHLFAGGQAIARPLLEARSLPDTVRCVQYFCWHIATLALALQAAVFGVAAFMPGQAALAIVGTAFAAAIALLGIVLPPVLKISYKTMPQGWLFVPVSALGLAGLVL
ncbi:MAG: hypothetical protein AAGL24_28415 [Pseudomonadota bacterium]